MPYLGFAGMSAVANLGSAAINATSQSNMNLANREFNAQQAALNRQFQVQQTAQAEQYNTQMSDTAMSRRMADLRTAGVNPMLAATSLGSASSPTISAPGGSQASAPATQAPQWGNMLSGATSAALNAAQTIAQINQTNAQTKLTNSQTPTPQYVSVDTNADGTQSITVNANAGHELGDATLAQTKATVAQINSTINQQASTISLNDALTAGKKLDNQVAADTLQALVKAQNAQNTMSSTLASSGQKVLGTQVMGQNLGTWIEALRMIVQPTIGAVSEGISGYNKLQYPTTGR